MNSNSSGGEIPVSQRGFPKYKSVKRILRSMAFYLSNFT
jgi:hypothetical protein